MKKICILSAVNIKHMSLISLYTQYLIKEKIDFDLIYMDKYDIQEEFPAKNIYRFVNIVNPKLPKLIRGLKYFKFIKYAKKIIKKNNYDFIIVWNDVAIFLFGKFLSKKYPDRYCLNIRDYCHQKVKYIYNLFDKSISKSSFTTISSPGFKSFLPDYDYVNLNSLNLEVLSECKVRENLADFKKPIKITFVGNVRFFDINKKLLMIFKNDKRFELHYYGTNSQILEEYAKENDIKNAVFKGSFPVKDTFKYINQTDIINNLYGNGSYSVDYALSIKLYYGIYCNIPILVEKNTYMEKICNELKIGYVVEELNEELKDNIYEWYTNLDFNLMKTNNKNELNRILEENEKFIKELDKYVK